ncbi:hypothetical protein DRP04_15235 [Archaeoglobales archaeon]|nr:MAG: hypothetical protein DRP04_15235 [Archaeoglobales archaeon]
MISKLLEIDVARLSLAVYPIDDYGGRIKGRVNVHVNCRKAIKNRSGYHIFLNLPYETCTVSVTSDFYFDEEVEVDLSALDPLNPVVSVTLKPNPAYPFSPGATLIRGIVCDSDGKPVSNAVVRVGNKETRTSEKGEFVLYFKLKKEDIVKVNGKKFVKGNNGKMLHIEVFHSKGSCTAEVEVEEGKTVNLNLYLS